MYSSIKTISVGGRSSPLSQAQVREVEQEVKQYHPEVEFESTLVSTTGDQDLSTSLRTLGKTDFFTKEIDQLLLKGECRIAIHSAKDLPDPLPTGLIIAALTRGVDSSDALVIASGYTLQTLPKGARIATSSERREEVVKSLRPDFQFSDIRGTIGDRLAKLENGEVEGVVIAEAALVRLGFTHLNRVRLPEPAAPYQGRLAILCRKEDSEMETLFRCLDRRKTVLYLGLDPPSFPIDIRVRHCPIIKIIPKPLHSEAFRELPHFTHLIFTSKTAVKIFFNSLPDPSLLATKMIIAVGKATAAAIRAYGVKVTLTSKEEHAEGIVEELKNIDTEKAYFFWPHSSLARTVLTDYFMQRGIRYREVVLYEIHFEKIFSSLEEVDEIVFTSPSTVEAFLENFGSFPQDKVLRCIGPVTEKVLLAKLDLFIHNENQSLTLEKENNLWDNNAAWGQGILRKQKPPTSSPPCLTI